MEDIKQSEEQIESTATDSVEQAPVQEDAYKAQFLRVSADFANYKRRMDKERMQWATTGQVAVVTAFLPILDDIERALDATRAAQQDGNDELASALEGLELIEKNLNKVLSELGVVEVACDGAFDPHYHEALMQTHSDEHESGQIVQVLSKGYTYKDVVIRHAKVSVAQ